MNTTAPPFELHALEKLREEELEEARAIQSGHARSISSLHQRLPQPETLRDPPGLIRRGELRDADPAIARR